MTVHYCKKCKNILVAVYHMDAKKYVLLCKTCSKVSQDENDFIYDLDENVLHNESSNIDIFDVLVEENIYDPICPFIIAKCDTCKKNTKLKVFPYKQKKNYICTECKTVYKG